MYKYVHVQFIIKLIYINLPKTDIYIYIYIYKIKFFIYLFIYLFVHVIIVIKIIIERKPFQYSNENS